MKKCGLPQWLLLMMAVFFLDGVNLQRDVDMVDYFAGTCGMSAAWRNGGYKALSHELKHDRVFQDINSPEGFVTAMLYGARVCRGGLGWYGVVCSTWIWMCSKSTGRHLDPMGNRNQEVPCFVST